jgi:hypothetical protein
MKSAFATGALDPETVGRRVLQAIQDNEFCILTHTNERKTISKRFDRIRAAFDRADAVMPTIS